MSIKEIALACLNQERDVAATELKAQDTKIQKLQEINSLKASYYGNRAVNIVEMITEMWQESMPSHCSS